MIIRYDYYKLINNILLDMDPLFYKNLFTIEEELLRNSIHGGIIIAVASTLYYFLFGGILGMSGLAGSLIKFPTRQTTKMKALVVVGIILASALFNTLFEYNKIKAIPFDSISFTLGSSTTKLIVAGALVGFGTDLSNGCTSGHGLCGMPRLSIRSFASVLVFLSTAIITGTYSLSSYIPQIPQLKLSAIDNLEIDPIFYLGGLAFLGIVLMFLEKKPFIAKIALIGIGFVFGLGLMIAGMSQRTNIYGFLELNSEWNPSLLFVLMTGVTINLITFNIIKRVVKQPAYGQKIEDPQGKITFKLIIGSILFGLGWGIGGLCPGPFLLSIPNSLKIAFYWGIPFFFAQKISHILFGEVHQQHHKDAQHKHQKKIQETEKSTNNKGGKKSQ